MRLKALVIGGLLSLLAVRVEAAQVQVAVAANFTEPAKEIAALFKQKTGNDVLLSFGASGVFYTQITHGAPFQILLLADEDRPKQAVEKVLALAKATSPTPSESSFRGASSST